MRISTKQTTTPFGDTSDVGYCNLKNNGHIIINNTVSGVFSIYIKCSSSGKVTLGSQERAISSEWNRYIFTDVGIGASLYFTQGEYYLYDAKFETGDKATAYTPCPTDDPVMYDNVIYDTSGYSNNASVTDSTCPTWSSDTPRYKGSYSFNGSDQYINCGTSTMIDGQEEITINCWAYMDDWSNFNARLFSCTEGGGYNTEAMSNSIKFALSVYTASDKSKYAYNSSTGGYPGIKLSDMTSGWHMITCIYKASVGDAIYLDGKLYEKNSYTSYGIHFNKNSYLFLGGESSGVNCIAPYFNGRLSDFRIYANTLSDFDILELYQSSASVDNGGNLSTYEIEEEL